MSKTEEAIKTLEDAAELIRDTVAPSEIEVMPYVGLEHIQEGTLQLSSHGWSNQVNSAKTRFKRGDILFGKLRPYFRKVIRAPFDGVCSTDIWVIRAKEGIEQGYLYYWMASEDFINAISNASEGTKMPRAKWEYAKQFTRSVPPLAEQRRIAHILGTLDDKIELNGRMNTTLEAIARAIFKSWFVDFDPVRAKAAGRPSGLPPALDALFPSRFVDSELGEIPEGWEVAQLSELGQIVCGKTPPKVRPEYFDGPIPFIKIPDMHNSTFVVNTIDSLTQEGANSQLDKYLPPESILVSCIATVGLVSLTSQKSQTNQQINAIIPKYANSVFFLYFLAKNLEQKLKDLGSGGSATLNVNTSIFSSIRSLYPGNGVVSAFDQAIRPIFNLILSSLRENNTLANTRDSLLSELMY